MTSFPLSARHTERLCTSLSLHPGHWVAVVNPPTAGHLVQNIARALGPSGRLEIVNPPDDWQTAYTPGTTAERLLSAPLAVFQDPSQWPTSAQLDRLVLFVSRPVWPPGPDLADVVNRVTYGGKVGLVVPVPRARGMGAWWQSVRSRLPLWRPPVVPHHAVLHAYAAANGRIEPLIADWAWLVVIDK